MLDGDDDTERSIDELLASLGGFDEDEAVKTSTESSSEHDQDTKIDEMIDSLQDWRAKNQEKPFADWDADTKEKFNVSACYLVVVLTDITSNLLS